MYKTKLTAAKARILQALFANPLTADTVNGLEDAYRETLIALGNKGRLTTQFMIDLDRVFSRGLYTLTYRLSLYVDDEMEIDLGLITGVSFINNELRLNVKDGVDEFSILIRAEG